MARPRKTGLDYFPFDVDFFSDEKVVCIAGEYGVKGELTIIKLLCAIYRNGYFVVWCDSLKYKLTRELDGVSGRLLEEIVRALVKRGFFDRDLFYSGKVLTSKGIQRRYFEACRLRKRGQDLPYLLVPAGVSSMETGVSSLETRVSNKESTQSKVKEKKLNLSSDEDKRGKLSIINILRCRRSVACRSRWSQYI